MEIFKLVGNIMVDAADAQKSISKTGEQAEGMASKLGNGIKTAGKWAAGIAGAAVAVGAAMVKAAQDTAKEMDTIDKASQRMKIDAESYQELAYAAELSGVEMSTLEKAAKKLEGTGLNMDDALDQIMKLGTAEERAAAAADLFGESVAYQMTPLLNAGAEGLQSMKDEAHALGLVMDNDTVSAGASMNDMFTKIKSSLGMLKNTLVKQFMPYIMQILQWLIDNIPTILKVIQKVMDTIMPIVKPILDAVMSLFEAFFALINGDWETFGESIKNVIINLGKGLYNAGKTAMEMLWNGLKSVWELISNWLSEKFSGITNFFSNIGGTVSGWFSHAGGTGDGTIPYDNYPAMLHKGETVLNANNTSALMEMIKAYQSGTGAGNEQPINITVQSVLDGRVIGESVATYNRQKTRAFG